MEKRFTQSQIDEILKKIGLTEKDIIISNPIRDFVKEHNSKENESEHNKPT